MKALGLLFFSNLWRALSLPENVKNKHVRKGVPPCQGKLQYLVKIISQALLQ